MSVNLPVSKLAALKKIPVKKNCVILERIYIDNNVFFLNSGSSVIAISAEVLLL